VASSSTYEKREIFGIYDDNIDGEPDLFCRFKLGYVSNIGVVSLIISVSFYILSM